ncbi:hypothetical protein ACC755_09740 [Rhizobium ruizarguesonis]|uniref:hypothetical protein n=1 Tax=Rhizobium ruizarguesonis TaxID=2081791 RepID=UPI0010326B98|nr:hypothetical protein [Rhizobium ruizarguesonis]TAY84516.1 hypothetical protein ELH85_32325 [Rhizobium ruizarguesonis]
MAVYIGKTAEQQRTYRNEYVLAQMYTLDVKYNRYESDLTKEMQRLGFGAAVTNIALTSVASQIASVQAKNVLSATAAGLTGVKAAYDKDVLLDRTVQIIQSQMRASRAEVAARIFTRLKLPADDYPLMMAWMDLQEYYKAGTLGSALIDAGEEAGDRSLAATSEKNMIVVKGASPRDPEVLTLRGFLYPDGSKLDRKRYQYLYKALANQQHEPLFYIAGQGSEAVRTQLLRCAASYTTSPCAAGSISNP